MNVMIVGSQRKAPEFAHMIKDRKPDAKVYYTNDGEEALNVLKRTEFDVIVTDIPVSKVDGLELLGYLYEHRLQTNARKFVLSLIATDRCVSDAFYYGITFYMVRPLSNESILNRILSEDGMGPRRKFVPRTYDTFLSYGESKAATREERNLILKEDSDALMTKITDIFGQLGATPNVTGYHYAKDGIQIMFQNQNNYLSITKEVYPEIAKKYRTTPSRVERSIRHMIEKTWKQGSLDEIDHIFGSTVAPEKGRPTNSEFMAAVCEYIKMTN